MAQIRLGSSVRVRYTLSYVGPGLEYKQDPYWFLAGMEMWAQECFSGASAKAGPSMVQCQTKERAQECVLGP